MKNVRCCTVIVLLVTAGLGLTAPAKAGPFGTFKFENPLFYIQGASHMLNTPDAPPGHQVVPPAAFWSTPFTLAPAPAAAVRGSSRHIVAPHPWDPPFGPVHTYTMIDRAKVAARLMHSSSCPDVFVEVLARGGLGMVYAAIGRHDPPPGCPGLQCILTGEEENPPTPTPAIAASAFNIMLADNSIVMSIVASGINQSDLIASAIHLGPPGAVGPPIYELGPGDEWIDLEGTGIARSVEGVFPAEYLPALLAGETYINLCTMSFPEGELRGQLTVANFVGDLNCDGACNAFDIDPFVLALTDPNGYWLEYPECDVTLGDINGDGNVNAFDIDPFVRLLTGGTDEGHDAADELQRPRR